MCTKCDKSSRRRVPHCITFTPSPRNGVTTGTECVVTPVASERPARGLALQACHACEGTACSEKLRRCALLNNLASVQDDDLVRTHDRAHAVRDHDDGLVREEPAQRVLHFRFVLHVEAGRGLVQKDDGRVLEQRAGDGYALSLAAGKPRC